MKPNLLKKSKITCRILHVRLWLLIISIFFLLFTACTGFSGLKERFTREQPVKTSSDDLPFTRQSKKKPLRPLPVNRPRQITFEADPVLYADVSSDGKQLLYSSDSMDIPGLWLRSVDPALVTIPEKLDPNAGTISDPRFSPDGRSIVFTGTGYDAKGDIYILALDDVNATARRLTGRETEDGGPCFSPDGKTIYFHQALPGKTGRYLASINADSPESSSVQVNPGMDGSFPSVSPDGGKLAYVSYRDDPAGDIFYLTLNSGEVVQVTQGPERDLFPAWSEDGDFIYFSRFGHDTDHDGKITLRDNSALYRKNIRNSDTYAFPVSSLSYSAFQPVISGKTIYFLSTREGTSNLWALPLEGEIPYKKDVEEQENLALQLFKLTPPDFNLSILAYFRIIERYPKIFSLGAKAAYSIGRLYERLNLSESAMDIYKITNSAYDNSIPETLLSGIAFTALSARERWNKAIEESERRSIVNEALSNIQQIMAKGHQLPVVTGRGLIKQARLYADLAGDSESILTAINLLDKVLENDSVSRALHAEATLFKADLFSGIGRSDMLLSAYSRVITDFPEQEEWADIAVSRLLNLNALQGAPDKKEERIRLLIRVADRFREEIPRLAMGAWNRIGDIYYADDQWAQAKEAYSQVIDNFPDTTTQSASARLALAEILYQEERFRQALDLYENEITSRPFEDNLYGLIRNGYNRKSIAAAEYLFRLGELPAAQSLFIDLIREDYSLTEAHRGYIKCAQVLNRISNALSYYRTLLDEKPDDPITLYATGLCLTYLNDKAALEEARSMIIKAVEIQGLNEYFYQTLGYIYEVSETVYGEKGGLETALEFYRKAFYLNDPVGNPENNANLLLNLGNTHFLLNHYDKAFDYYSMRVESNHPFYPEEAEILFYQRFGVSAFHAQDTEKTILAFSHALDLINKRIEPKRASEVMGQINRYVVDRIIIPALKIPVTQKAEKIAEKQGELNQRLFEASSIYLGPSPNEKWDEYRDSLNTIISEQENIIKDLQSLIIEDGEEKSQTLGNMIARAREAMDFPRQMMTLKAEMHDRLGLAYQEAEKWQQAGQSFERAFELNERLGLFKNLAVNKRSIAYNKYQEAGSLSGQEKRRMLETALDDFESVIDLIGKYGVADKKQDKKQEALINISLDIELDKTGSSQAMFGFSSIQEQRLVEAFISRIRIELGELYSSRKAIRQQLAYYPSLESISEQDLYGVSLLHHRAGLLEYSLDDPVEAFDQFLESTQLSIKLGNPVSSAFNVRNMAQALMLISIKDPAWEKFLGQFSQIARRTERLLDNRSSTLERSVIPTYYNAVGIFYIEMLSRHRVDSIESGAIGSILLSEAFSHFASGLKEIERADLSGNRQLMALYCALHLNMAEASLLLTGPDSVKEHYEIALNTARRGLLPNLEWRALLKLKRYKEALEILESLPILRTGCSPGEITGGFSLLGDSVLKKGDVDEAFYLVEKLSELERINRLSYMLSDEIDEQGKDILKSLYPRLITLKRLDDELSRADKKEKEFIQKRIDQEKEIYKKEWSSMGSLPFQDSGYGSESIRELMIILYGLSFHMEDVADQAVRETSGDKHDSLIRQYYSLNDEYLRFFDRLGALIGKEKSHGLAGLIVPDPVEIIDVMENLSDEGRCIRLLRVPHIKDGWLAFIITPDDVQVRELKSLSELDLSPEGMDTVIYEDPALVSFDIDTPVCLSATHFVRSVENRKPFRKNVLTIPDDYSLPGYFTGTSLPAKTTDSDIKDMVPEAHTLLMTGHIGLSGSVPTRPGEKPKESIAMIMDLDRSIPISILADSLSNTSLAILTDTSMENVYALGHLFSSFGVPTILLHTDSDNKSLFKDEFFKAYENSSAVEAFISAKEVSKNNEKWTLMGFRGMSGKEATLFAKKNFMQYARGGIKAFQDREYPDALIQFENGINIATEEADLKRYLPDLFTYARECAYILDRLDKAAFYARALVNILAENDPDSEKHASALLKLGLILARAEKYPESIPVIEEAVEIMENLELGVEQVGALSDLGVVLENATEYDRALLQFKSAVTLSKSLDKKEFLARQYTAMGRIYDLRMSMYAVAIKSYRDAFSIYEELKNNTGMAESLLNIGRCYRLLGNFKDAKDNYSKALDLIGSDDDQIRIMAKIRIEQANNAWYQGRYQEAFNIRNEVDELAKQNDWPLEQVILLNTSGLIWWTLGDHERALRELEEGLSIATTLRARKDEVATTLNNIGLVYREMGRFSEAISTLEKALTIDRAINSKWAIAYDLKNLGLTYIRMEQPDKAIPLFEEALTTTRSIGNRINEAKTLIGLGEAFVRLNQDEEARNNLEKALELARSMALRETEWRALFWLGKLRIKQGFRDDAIDYMMKAMTVIEGMRAEIKIDQLKDGFIDNKMAVYETLVSLLVDSGKPDEAFEIAERSRARNLIDLLGNQRLTLRGATNQELYDRQRILRSNMREQEVLLAQSDSETEKTVYSNALERLNDEYRDLMLKIQVENPELASLISVNPLSLEELKNYLEQGVGLLAYYMLPDELLCWLVTKDTTELFRTDMPKAELEKKIITYRRVIQNLEPFERQSKELYSLLFSKVISRIGSTSFLTRSDTDQIRVIGVVPHGALHYLSFATLFDGENFVVDRFPLFYLPSASVLRYTLDRRKQSPERRVLAIGNPDLKDPALDLPFAEKEVATIGWNFPDMTLLTREKATESWFVKHIGDFGIIHLASHGEFDPINPLFSAVKLVKDLSEDGDLEAFEVFGLEINADLVVLSACQSGLGKVTSGDDVIGMNRSFLYGGTHAILSTLWRVSDISTAILIKQFYRRYVTENKSESLRHAMLSVKNQYPHPGYWGAFVLVGDYY